MKIGQIALVGGVLAAVYYRDKIIPYLGNKAAQIEDKIQTYATNKIKIQPSGLPKVGVSIKRGAVDLKGSLDLTSKIGYTATLNTYRVNLILEKGTNKIILGKTPLETPNKKVVGNTKTSINYRFSVPMDSITRLIQDKELQGYNLFVYVDELSVNRLSVPSIKIDISKTWKDIAKAVSNPASLITDLFKRL